MKLCRWVVVSLSYLLAGAVVAGAIFATLRVKLISNPDLRKVTADYPADAREAAANRAYREQVSNKTAVPKNAQVRVEYADDSSETATVTSPLFSYAVFLNPGSLRRPGQGGKIVSSMGGDPSYEVQIEGHWEWYDYVDAVTGKYWTSSDAEFIIDKITITTKNFLRILQ